MEDNVPPNKRRRLNAAAALSRPFKSPLRKTESVGDASHAQGSPRTPSASRTAQDEASTPTGSSCLGLTTPSPVSSQTMPTQRLGNRPVPATPTQSPLTDPELLLLQKQERALVSRIAALREELNIVKQAVRIETSNKDAELEALIIKWRHASQEAADEVFAGAQERVTQMGGLAAWKERSKCDASSNWGYEDENKERAGGYGDEGDEYWDLGDVFVEEEKKDPTIRDDESLDEEFSMGFMLKTLSIDPQKIGYDSNMGKWIRK